MNLEINFISIIVNFLVTIGVFRVFEYRINKRFDIVAKRDELRYMDKRKLAEQVISILVNAGSENYSIPLKDPSRIRKVIGHVSVFDEELGGKLSEFVTLLSINITYASNLNVHSNKDVIKVHEASMHLNILELKKLHKELLEQFKKWL